MQNFIRCLPGRKTILNGLMTAVLAAGITAGPALSADLGRPRGYTPPASTKDGPGVAYERRAPTIWEGLYYGVSVGYGWGQSEHNYDRNDNHGLATQDLEGATASVTFGYNKMLSRSVLVGIEGDIGFMDLNADDKVIFDGHVWKTQFGPFWGTLRARAGFVWNGILLFGTGGLAFMMVDEVGYGDAAGQTAENRDVRTGWVVGGGLEFALAPGVTTKVEYLHMDFGRYDGLSENQENFYFDNKVDLVRAGINFKF